MTCLGTLLKYAQSCSTDLDLLIACRGEMSSLCTRVLWSLLLRMYTWLRELPADIDFPKTI